MAKKNQIAKSVLAPLAAWAVAKVLDSKPLKGASEEADAYAVIGQRRATRAIRRAGRNAAKNRTWLAAGVAAVAVGLGMMAKSTRPK
jgi:hypothetical protein